MRPADLTATLRRHYRGLLAIGDRFDPVCFVIHPASGRPVMAVAADALTQEAVTLHVPDDSGTQSVHLLGRPAVVDPARDPAADRFLVYHGTPRTRCWLAIDPESAKSADGVLGADEIDLTNTLHSAEPALCRALNADPGRLSALCRAAAAGTAPSDPRAVGVDPQGVDIRASFGIIRVEFRDPIASEHDLGLACEAFLHGDRP